MSEVQTSLQFRANSVRAVEDSSLRAAMRNATDTFGARREAAFEAIPDMESLREQASAIRLEVLDNLPAYLEQFTASAERAGAGCTGVRTPGPRGSSSPRFSRSAG